MGVPRHRFDAKLWTFYRHGGREAGVADVIDRAEQIVEGHCMRQAGFSYWPVPQESTRAPLLDGLSDTPSGAAPPERAVLRTASEQGYGLYARFKSRSLAASRRNSVYVNSLSASAQQRYQRAAFGSDEATIKVRFPDGSFDTVPAHGCQAESSRTVYGSLARDDFRLNAVALVQHMVATRVSSTAAVKTATARWSRCLRRRAGRAFPTPGAVANWVTSQYLQHGADQRTAALEVRYATTSTRCAYATDLATRYAATTWSTVETMPDAWYRTIVEVRAWDAKAVTRARTALR